MSARITAYIKTLALEEAKIGEVFTPLQWAKWLVIRSGVFEKWVEGSTICDPTAGTGVFALALMEEAHQRGVSITDDLLSRLVMVELRRRNIDVLQKQIELNFGLCLPEENIIQRDVILNPLEQSFDILIGNPPWSNFTDLPQDYKETLKPYFIEYGLVPDRKAVLLGSSRTDIAALVLKAVIHKMLNNGGDAYFFTPLSLFTGDDAHIGFRDYRSKSDRFSVEEIFEFSGERVFEGIGTSYCACHFHKGSEQSFPIPYFRGGKEDFVSLHAIPLKISSDPLRVVSDTNSESESINVTIKPEQKPRQGVNSCGASSIFIFNSKPDFLDSNYVFPLASKEVWRTGNKIPKKWIFLPYDRNSGRPLSEREIQSIKGFDYLVSSKEALKKRKGTLIQGSIDKGIWWSLLGVGPYSFAPYKVVWEAYGKHTFNPIVLDEFENQPWQGNQAMHAFIPCQTYEDAHRICEELKCPQISRLLCELNGQGKCNFAQPGKMKKILTFSEEVTEQMMLLEPKQKYRKRLYA